MTYKKKLIEVAIPLEAINKESAREKSIRHGHPSTIHLWWARIPLASSRAVLFAQLVDDPSSNPDKFPTEKAQEKERQRLFKIIEELVKWENIGDEKVLEQARNEILKSCDGKPPLIYDPFCGGGSIPLEAQRLGLKSYGSDLNPVAVMISKALIEIPTDFLNKSPINPNYQSLSETEKKLSKYQDTKGLIEDIKYYGQWIKDEAYKKLKHLYPTVYLPKELGGEKANVIAWLWTRTIASPNPALEGAHVPLIRSFELLRKKDKLVSVKPIIDLNKKNYIFEVVNNSHTLTEGTVNRNGARCLISNVPIPFSYIRAEAKAGRMGYRLLALIAEGKNRRVYLSPTEEMEHVANCSLPENIPEANLPEKALGFRVQAYGMNKYHKLFTNRQLTALTTFSSLVLKVREKILEDINYSESVNDNKSLANGGTGIKAYAEAVCVYLAFAVDRLANRLSTICVWNTVRETIEQTFARQAIPMVWDFAEANPFSESSGNFYSSVELICKVLEKLPSSQIGGHVNQYDAIKGLLKLKETPLISTDPPYFDNIGYADLSDFFYIWMRSMLKDIYPQLFSTLLTPKESELVAAPYRHGSKEKAKEFFLDGMTKAFMNIADISQKEYPLTIYYAFKQSESDEEKGTSSTGWETFLDAVIRAGLSIYGTWPIKTVRPTGVKNKVNALASAIVLVCRKLPKEATITTRGEFLKELKHGLPKAIKQLQHGYIAPVDLPQACIGPGMSIFTQYSKVLEADGKSMTVRTALQLINQALDEYFSKQEGSYDSDTRFAITWFEQYGLNSGPYGDAETIAMARNISVNGVVEAGILESKARKVRLLKREELPLNWDPYTDNRLTIWESTQYLIRELQNNGEIGAAALLYKLGSKGELARELAYRLYDMCDKKKWAEEAFAYNSLVIAWPNIVQLTSDLKGSEQIKLNV